MRKISWKKVAVGAAVLAGAYLLWSRTEPAVLRREAVERQTLLEQAVARVAERSRLGYGRR